MSIRIGRKVITGGGSGGNVDVDNKTINKNSADELQSIGLIDKNTNSNVIYDWVGTFTEYTDQNIPTTHPDWICYITDDSISNNATRNIGDIFYTTRLDTSLSGAVECDGSTYNITDFVGQESIGNLLKTNKLPYVSLSVYNSIISTYGNCRAFGWDGGENIEFRVPLIKDIFIEAGTAASTGEVIPAGLPNITGYFTTYEFGRTNSYTATGAFYVTGTGVKGTNSGSDEACGLNFDASRSSSIYGKSTTVQPKSIKYRAMIQIFNGMQNEALLQTSNIIADGANLLGTNSITNCITEIPQDIKLELNDGVLTLKKGSKIYYPNGVGVFDVINVENDLIVTHEPSGQRFVVINNMGNLRVGPVISTEACSGTTDTLSGLRLHTWYDTTNNIIRYYGEDGTTQIEQRSLPLAIVTVSNGAISSIDQVFNGFGFFGSTLFVLPGVKGLMPDGRNADGTLRNKYIEITKVITRNDFTESTLSLSTITYNQTDNAIGHHKDSSSTGGYVYDKENNIYYTIENGGHRLLLGRITVDDGKIIDLKTNYTFHAVDYNYLDIVLNTIYPVGSIYIGTQDICPMSLILTNSIWEKIEGDKVLQSSSSSHAAGSTIDAGLPNITGSVATESLIQGVSGAFTTWTTSDDGGFRGGEDQPDGIKFDASRCSSIYGKSTTVQPPAYVVNVWRRIA